MWYFVNVKTLILTGRSESFGPLIFMCLCPRKGMTNWVAKLHLKVRRLFVSPWVHEWTILSRKKTYNNTLCVSWCVKWWLNGWQTDRRQCAHALFFTALSLSSTPRWLGRFFVHVFSEEQLFMVFKHAMAVLKVDWVNLPNEGASKSRELWPKNPISHGKRLFKVKKKSPIFLKNSMVTCIIFILTVRNMFLLYTKKCFFLLCINLIHVYHH